MYVPYQIYYSSSVWEWDHTKVEHIIMSRLRLRMVRPWSDQLDRFRRLCGMDHWNGLLDWPFCTNNHVYLQYNDTALSLVRKLVIGSQLCIHQAMNFNKARRISRMSPNPFHVDGSRYETIFCNVVAILSMADIVSLDSIQKLCSAWVVLGLYGMWSLSYAVKFYCCWNMADVGRLLCVRLEWAKLSTLFIQCVRIG